MINNNCTENDYEKILIKQKQELIETKKPVILFGTLAMGLIGKRVLEFFNVKMACFCDNNKQVQGKAIEGIEVLSPQQVKEKYPDAKIYICSFNNQNLKVIEKQLMNLGFSDINEKDMLLYVYQIEVMKRPIKSCDLAKTLYKVNGNSDENNLILHRIGFSITTKCSLRCKDCCALIPYFRNPSDQNKDTVINSMKILSKSVDAIKEISIFGGEPFLSPDLIEICNYAARLNNVGRVLIVTNGTIAPDADMLKLIRNAVSYIEISDYGDLSKAKSELQTLTRENNICLQITDKNREWIDSGKLKPRNRTTIENEELFERCSHRYECYDVINGELYFCGRAAFGATLGVIPKNENDYIDLLDNNMHICEIREKISRFIKDTKTITACDYCDWPLEKKISPALQLKD